MDYGNNYPPRKPITVNFGGGKLRRILLSAAALLLVLILAATTVYTVNDKETAVVTTFGRVTDIRHAGMHFKLPFGIQRVHKVQENVYQKIELGYRSTGGSGFEVVENESKMITGDYNIVNVDFLIEYKISDPVKYLYHSYEPATVLKNLVQSQIRSVIGSSLVDSVLTAGKAEIQIRVKELITRVLEDYDIGLMLTDVKIQDAEPPTQEVIQAFKNVETAKQGAETAINEAKAYENAQLPRAQAQADQLLQNAEYLRQNRINEASQQVAMFEAMFAEYTLNPGITRTRMYYEAIRAAFPGVKIFIDTTGSGDIQKILPLDGFIDTGSAQSGGTTQEGGGGQ